MTQFCLPDLGEGLPDAEIRRWYINVGDIIKTDEPMVAMETAKAVVDIPAPFCGKIIQLYGKPGDIIKTGEALVDIEGRERPTDKATVVGDLQITDTIIKESATGITPNYETNNSSIKATPAIRALARKMRVDLTHCTGTGPAGQITVTDIENALKPYAEASYKPFFTKPTEGYEPLRGPRRAMAIAMSKSHQTVVPVTIVDDANIHSWPEKTDVTLRVIQAIMAACHREPRLNAWFDDTNLSLHLHQHINLGIAIDASGELFVPVLKNIAQCNPIDLRMAIDRFKLEVKSRNVSPENLTNATFVLSNVGVFAGRYATPLITPPMVAILAVGRIIEAVIADQGKPVVHRLLPLSLTVDHRVITGGEAARFLSELIRNLKTA